MRVAAIDCGTNSIRLLIADVEGANLREIVREMTIVRLGEGVDRTGAFAPAALPSGASPVTIGKAAGSHIPQKGYSGAHRLLQGIYRGRRRPDARP